MVPCGLPRRLGAIFYDSLLLVSLLFFATLVILPFTGGQAISSDNVPFHVYLFLISYLYFVWHWAHGGQTLGMRAWRLRLYTEDHRAVSWHRASQRFLASLLSWILVGGGFVWSLFDENSRTLHDRLSKTCLAIEKQPGEQ